jgi:hypothetical protein
MKATVLLCDYATVADGKLFISGGGWSITGPSPKGYLALLLAVPWDLANHRLNLSLDFKHEDGGAFLTKDAVGNEVPLIIRAEIEVGRPAGLLRGVSLDVPLAIELPSLQLAPGRRYEWVLTIDGENKEDWRVAFLVRG